MKPVILLFEENRDIRDLVTFLLEERGYEVVSTDSLVEGEEELVCRRVDLFLADTTEPTKERAMDVFHQVCSVAGDEVPIVIFTAHPVVRQEAQEAGCADAIQKPFDIDELIQRIEENLRQPAGSG